MKTKSLLSIIIACGLLLAVAGPAQAQSIWANSNVSGATPTSPLDWLTGGPNTQGTWTGGTPTSANTTTVQFFQDVTTALPNIGASGNSQTNNVNNGGTAFQLGTLTLDGKASATTGANLTETISGDPLNFSGSTGTINLNGVINTRTLTFNINSAIQLGTASNACALTLTGAGTGTFNINGVISELQTGGGSLIKSGSSTFTLGNTVNSFTGNVILYGGTLLVGTTGSASGLGSAGTLIFGGSASFNTPYLANGVPTIFRQGVTVSNGFTATFNIGDQYNYAVFKGPFSGSGTLYAYTSGGAGSSLMFSNAANTFTGTLENNDTGNSATPLTVNSLPDSANPIQLTGSSYAPIFALGAGTATPLVFNSRQIQLLGTTVGGEVDNNNGNATNTITINTGLGVVGTGNKTFTLGGSNTSSNTFAGSITNGTGSVISLAKAGTGTWTISGNMSHTGGLTMNGASGTLILSGTNTYSGQTVFSQLGQTLVFAGIQAVSPNTSFLMNNNASTGDSTMKLLDDTGGSTSTVTVSNTFTIQNNNTPGNAHTFIVGNNNTANGGTSSGTTTGSTIALQNLNWGTEAASTTAFGPIQIQGTGNGYRLQINNVTLYNASNSVVGASGPTAFTPTTANVTLGTVTMATGNAGKGVPYLVLDGTSTDNRITGVISDATDAYSGGRPLNFTKQNTSTWTLSGTNTYTGTTTVTGGRLIINGNNSAATNTVTVSGGTLGGTNTVGGAVTLSSTGGIDLRDGAVGTLTLTNGLAITGAAGANNLYFDFNGSSVDQIAVTGNVTMTTAGAGVIVLNLLSTTLTDGTYDLITATGTMPAAANFTMSASSALGKTFTLQLDGTSKKLQLVVGTVGSSTAANCWSGASSVNWSAAGNWNTAATGGTAAGAAPGYQANVSFYTTTPVAANLTTDVLDTDFDINSLTFLSTATTGVTIGGTTKTLTIEAGTANGNTASNGITLNNTSGTHTISAKVGLGTNQTWTVASGATLAVSGAISDFGLGYSLTKAGGGTLTLSGANTYSGGTTLNGGTLAATSDANLGATVASPALITAAQVITVTGNSTLALGSGGATCNRSIFLNGANIFFPGSGNNPTITGPVTGSGNITNMGGNNVSSVTLSSLNNTFTGSVNLGNGGPTSSTGPTITVASLADSAGAGSIIFNYNYSAAIPATFNYAANAVVPLALTNRQIVLAVTSGTAGAGKIVNQNATYPIIIAKNLVANNTVAQTLQLDAVAGPTNLFAGNITNGSGGAVVSLTKSSAGTWALSGTNTYTGATIISGGTLSLSWIDLVANANPLGKSTADPKNLQLSGGTLQYTGGAASTDRNFALVASSTIDASGTGALVFSQNNIISPDGGSGLSFNYTTNSFVITGLSSTANLAVGEKFTSSVSGITSTTISTIDSATQVTLAAKCTGVPSGSSSSGAFGYAARTLTLTGTSTATNTLAGILQDSSAAGAGALSLTKTGVGTWVLTGANTYSGATTVSAGTLLVNGNSIAVTNAVTVANGATIGGTGTFGGVVNYQNGSLAAFTLTTEASDTYSNSTYLTFTNAVFMTNVTVGVAMPTGLGNGTYVLATNYLGFTTIGSLTFAQNSGSLGTGGSGVISVSGKNLILTVTGVVGGGGIATTNTVTTSGSPAPYSTTVTFTCTVQTNSPVGVATGAGSNVVFSVNGTPVATNGLSGGVATYAVNTLTVSGSPYTVQAVYLGDGTYLPSTNTVSQAITPLPPVQQMAPLASSITYGQALSNSIVTGGVFTNLAGATVTMTSTNFVTPGLVPNVGMTNVSVYFVPVDATDYLNATNQVTVTVLQISNNLALVAVPSQTNGYNDSVSYTATVQTNGVTAGDATGPVVFSYSTYGTNAAVAFSTNNCVGGVASSVTISNQLPRGTNLITAAYASYGNYLGWTNSLIQTVTNHPPVVSNFSMGALSGTPVTIQIIDGKYTPTDADGDALTVSAVQNPSAANGVVTTDGTNVTYTATNTFAGTDTFTYAVSDSYGGTNTATVTVNVVTNGGGYNLISGPVNNGNGTSTIHYAGIPGFSYALETTPSLALPITWTPVQTNTAATNGSLSFTFSTAVGQGYFRTHYISN